MGQNHSAFTILECTEENMRKLLSRLKSVRNLSKRATLIFRKKHLARLNTKVTTNVTIENVLLPNAAFLYVIYSSNGMFHFIIVAFRYRIQVSPSPFNVLSWIYKKSKKSKRQGQPSTDLDTVSDQTKKRNM